MEPKQVLFCAESVYQLFNAITLRMTEKENDVCDLVLSSATNWNEEMLERLRATKIFDDIYQPQTRVIEWDFWDKQVEEQKIIVQDPILFFGEYPFTKKYNELFVPIDHIFWKMIYQYQKLEGLAPKVFMYDEGLRAYTMYLPGTDNKPYLVGNYMENPFIEAVEAYYLYQPEVYSVNNYNYELRKLPNPALYPNIKEVLITIFGYEEMPKEDYIYLEDFFFADRYITNDFELFKQVAELVGRENIITKCHPRDYFNRFDSLGYKTVGNHVVPWEIQLLANDLRTKVLISVSSTSILTPFIIFNSDMHVISLEKMFIGENPAHKDAAFRTYFEKVKKKINQDSVHFHTPETLDEFKEVLRYIKICQSEIS